MVEIDLVFSEQLRTARRNAGLSLAEASDGICSISYLSLIESGKRNANPRMARELAARMEIKLPAPLITAGVHPLSERAELAYRTGGMKAAKKFIDRMDNAPESLLIQGLDAERNGKLDESAKLLKAAFEAPFVSPVTKMSVALARTRVLRGLGHIQHAISIGEYALEEWRGYSEELTEVVVALRGTVAGAYIEMGDLGRASELSDLDLNELPSPRAKALNLWAKSDIKNDEGDFIEAELLTREALVWARMAEYPQMRASLLICRAIMGQADPKPDFKGITAEIDEAAELIEEFEGNMSWVHQTRMLIAARTGDRPGVMAAYELANHSVSEEEKFEVARFAYNCYTAFALVGMESEAKQELDKGLKALEETKVSRMAAILWRQLGEVFKNSGETDKAMMCLLKATEMLGLDAHVENFTAPVILGKKK
jgi:tetratricopeptide (TPR) repeat protein